MSQPWTPEPWIIDASLNSSGRALFQLVEPEHHYPDNPKPQYQTAQECLANKLRIEACVNACAGLTEEEIKEAILEWREQHNHS